MKAETFIPAQAIPALQWLATVPETEWWMETINPEGCKGIDLYLPPCPPGVDRASYNFVAAWVKGCYRAMAAGVQGIGELATIYSGVKIVGQGPKVYFPTAMQCEAMRHVTLDIPKDYLKLPYPAFIVYFPADFVSRGGKHFPRYAVACAGHDRRMMYIHSGDAQQTGMVNLMSLHTLGTIEHALRLKWSDLEKEKAIRIQIYGEDEYCDWDDQDYDKNEACQRLMLNFALMLTNCKHWLEYRDKPAAAALSARMEKRPALRQSLSAARKLLCEEIKIDSETVFYEDRREPGPALGGTHASPTPHWRRGHWRRVAGYAAIEAAGNKAPLVFIKPTLVNRHLLGGPPPAMGKEYRPAG